MALLQQLVLGFGLALQPVNLLCGLLGCLLGLLLRLLPGLGPLAAMAMLLPASLGLPPQAALLLLAGMYCAARYQSQPVGSGRTLLLAVCALPLLLAPWVDWLTELALQFGAAEYLALMVLALAAAVLLTPGSLLKALALVLLGMLLGLVGTDASSNLLRFTLDIPELAGGIAVPVLAMGLFGYGEVIAHLAAAPLPANAPEASGWQQGLARDAATQAVFLPLLVLGVPFNAAMAMLVAALGLQPLQTPQPGSGAGLVWGLLAALLLGQLLVLLLLSELRRRSSLKLDWPLPRLAYRHLYAAILLLCAMGAYAGRHSMLDVWLVAAFGVLGYVLKCLDMPCAPLLMGFVLGPAMEQRLRQTLLLAHGDWSVFVMRPLSAGLLLLALMLPLLLVLPALKRWRARGGGDGMV
jgi:TctA family transporter